MTDANTREHERQAAGGDAQAAARVLRARLRSGEVSREVVRLNAYLGDEAARVLVPDPPEGVRGYAFGDWSLTDAWNAVGWINSLEPLVAALPGEWSRACDDRDCDEGRWWDNGTALHCEQCNGTGQVSAPLAQHVAVRLLVAAGRAAYAVRWPSPHGRRQRTRQRQRDALEAAEAWLACPCKRHRGTCNQIMARDDAPRSFFEWWEMPLAAIRFGYLTDGLNAMARLTDVRAALRVVRV